MCDPWETHLTSQSLRHTRDETRDTHHLPHTVLRTCNKIGALQHPAQCLPLGQSCSNHSFTSPLPSNLAFFVFVNFYEGACLLIARSSSFILRVHSGGKNSHQPLAPLQLRRGCDANSPSESRSQPPAGNRKDRKYHSTTASNQSESPFPLQGFPRAWPQRHSDRVVFSLPSPCEPHNQDHPVGILMEGLLWK